MKITTLILTVVGMALSATASHAEEAERGGRGHGRAKLLEKFDTNGDGKLDPTERKEVRDTMKSKVVGRFDSDQDGALSADEKGQAKAAWAKMKDNHPGLRRAMAARHHGKGRGNCKDKGTDAPPAE
jgi:hypothetical protein